jgi:hypothetical protein
MTTIYYARSQYHTAWCSRKGNTNGYRSDWMEKNVLRLYMKDSKVEDLSSGFIKDWTVEELSRGYVKDWILGDMSSGDTQDWTEKDTLSGFTKTSTLEDVTRVSADRSGRIKVQNFHKWRSPGTMWFTSYRTQVHGLQHRRKKRIHFSANILYILITGLEWERFYEQHAYWI